MRTPRGRTVRHPGPKSRAFLSTHLELHQASLQRPHSPNQVVNMLRRTSAFQVQRVQRDEIKLGPLELANGDPEIPPAFLIVTPPLLGSPSQSR